MCCSVAQEEISCKLWSSPLHTERYDWCLVSQPRLRLIPGKPSQICKRSNRVSQSSSETAKHEFSPLIHAANHSQVFISSNTFAGLTGMSHVSVHSICNNLSAVKWLRRFALHAGTVGVHKRSYFFCVFHSNWQTLWMRHTCPCGWSSMTPKPPGPVNAIGNLFLVLPANYLFSSHEACVAFTKSTLWMLRSNKNHRKTKDFDWNWTFCWTLHKFFKVKVLTRYNYSIWHLFKCFQIQKAATTHRQ